MNYTEKLEFIEKLGWKVFETWANRDFYALEGHSAKFYMVEHNGIWSIGKDEDYYFAEDPTIEEIEEFTELAKKYFSITTEPETHTVKELFDVTEAIRNFYDKFESEEEDLDL